MQNDKKNTVTGELLEELLKTEPNYLIAPDFADRVTEKIARKMMWDQYLKEFLIYLAVIVGIAVSVAVMSIIWYGANWNEWASFMTQNTVLVAGVVFLVVFVLFVDRTLLPYFLHREENKIT